VKNYKFIAEYQPDKKVTVYAQYMPSDEFEDDTFYPCVVVTLRGVGDDGVDSLAAVTITLGVYGGERQDGWRDLLNLHETIRQYLLKTSVVADKYPREYPVLFEVLENQPTPFYYAKIDAQFRIAWLS